MPISPDVVLSGLGFPLLTTAELPIASCGDVIKAELGQRHSRARGIRTRHRLSSRMGDPTRHRGARAARANLG
ncbi:hypothetical protein F5B21DRAFT_497603 [Xylaria acuta]|nr:hypothetical protein F5B21DRAFT_497603 [Xylaria acuta]